MVETRYVGSRMLLKNLQKLVVEREAMVYVLIENESVPVYKGDPL